MAEVEYPARISDFESTDEESSDEDDEEPREWIDSGPMIMNPQPYPNYYRFINGRMVRSFLLRIGFTPAFVTSIYFTLLSREWL